MKTILMLICFTISWLAHSEIKAQSAEIYKWPLEITISNTGTFMPGGGALGIWSRTFHPGVSIGTRYYYVQREKYQLFQTATLGYFHHKYAQHGWQAYTALGYRYRFHTYFFAEARLGLGYLLSQPDLEVFNFQNGNYVNPSWKARHQLMGGLMITAGYDLSKHFGKSIDLYLGYQFWIQSPFVNKYVPILPNNSVHFGIIYYHNWFDKKS